MAREQLATFVRHLRRIVGPREPSGLTDAHLLERWVRQRDEAAFEVLLWRHGPMVLGVCRRLLSHAQDVEDAFQAAFLVLVRKAGAIRQRASVGSWLYKVAYRAALRARAAKVARREQPAVDVPVAEGESDLLWRDVRAVLDEEVARLPERYRAAFVLCYLEGKTNAEAAQELGCPLGTILSRLAWARERLRQRLTRRGVALSVGFSAALLSEASASAALPAALAGSTVRAALLFAAGQTTAAGAVSSQTMALTKGVLQAMYMTQMKIAAAVVLIVGGLGAGAGLLTIRARAEERLTAPANNPTGVLESVPQLAPAGAPVADKKDDIERAAQLDKARAILENVDVEWEKLEFKLTDELIQGRLDLVKREENIKTLEQLETQQRERETAKLLPIKRSLSSLRESLQSSKQQLGVEKDADQKVASLTQEIRVTERQLGELEDVSTVEEAKRAEQRIEARMALVAAQENLNRIERRQAVVRQRFQAKIEDAEERVRQLQANPLPAESLQRSPKDLDKKLDQILREVTELRREVQRLPSDKNSKPAPNKP
jgi:RNA polymerase sigma factor (sigma-70 family)